MSRILVSIKMLMIKRLYLLRQSNFKGFTRRNNKHCPLFRFKSCLELDPWSQRSRSLVGAWFKFSNKLRRSFYMWCPHPPPPGEFTSKVGSTRVSGHDHDSFHIYFLFLTALNSKHSSQEQRNIVNEFFERLESEVLPSPKDYQWPVFWSTFLVVCKSRNWYTRL